MSVTITITIHPETGTADVRTRGGPTGAATAGGPDTDVPAPIPDELGSGTAEAARSAHEAPAVPLAPQELGLPGVGSTPAAAGATPPEEIDESAGRGPTEVTEPMPIEDLDAS